MKNNKTMKEEMTPREKRVVRVIEIVLFDASALLCILMTGIAFGKGYGALQALPYVFLAGVVSVMRSVFKYLFWDKGTSLTEADCNAESDDED